MGPRSRGFLTFVQGLLCASFSWQPVRSNRGGNLRRSPISVVETCKSRLGRLQVSKAGKMWIKVRSMDGLKSHTIDGLSKLTKVEDLRGKLVKYFDAPNDRQRLFYRGKQMEDGHTLFEYNVNVNDTIQFMLKPAANDPIGSNNNGVTARSSANAAKNGHQHCGDTNDDCNKENGGAKETVPKRELPIPTLQRSKYFKVKDLVDAKDMGTGAWFEATIVGISVADGDQSSEASTSRLDDKPVNVLPSSACSQQGSVPDDQDDGLLYHVSYDDYIEDAPTVLKMGNLRPRAQQLLPFDDIEEGMMVMVNYNVEEPAERGFWYDACVVKKEDSRISKKLFATVFIGGDCTPLLDCKIMCVNEVYKITKPLPFAKRNADDGVLVSPPPVKRKNKIDCKMCRDKPDKKCHFCACHVCGGKNEPGKQIMCDECDFPFHIWCLTPPLDAVPQEDEWYCPNCKVDATEVVGAGEKLKTSIKKSKMASASTRSTRDWGKGMACAGRTTECTIVPKEHFGPIPGVEVGSTWKFRVQVSESGVHRPHVAGIHGREHVGAFSIVLAGGYEDDVDNGGEFTYTGSGGRDLSGNKRTAEQSWDQTLTRMNRALAMNCDAPIDDENGAEASDWTRGKPVRVVRSQKGCRTSDFCPKEGNRYDGIYKVVKYWPEKGMSGYLVWRYVLRRDDPVPPPWTKAGAERMARLGLKIQYPEGYLEAGGNSAKDSPEVKEVIKSSVKKKKLIVKLPLGKRKRDSIDTPWQAQKKSSYSLPGNVHTMIAHDVRNERLWQDCEKVLDDGRQAFLRTVEELFMCPCCQDLVAKPITTKCLHNICKECLSRSVKAQVFSCPACRNDIGQNPDLVINVVLDEILRNLFPGYETGR